jgi:hypothetical protein
MSLQEFLLQWPCEIRLPTGLEDAELIGKAYRSILLRAPEPAEIEQYLRLRREGVSTLWIVEDLVASEELRRLGRRLRVVMGGDVITEPGRSEDEKMPTVTWPDEHAIAAASERDSGMPELAPVVGTQ